MNADTTVPSLNRFLVYIPQKKPRGKRCNAAIGCAALSLSAVINNVYCLFRSQAARGNDGKDGFSEMGTRLDPVPGLPGGESWDLTKYMCDALEREEKVHSLSHCYHFYYTHLTKLHHNAVQPCQSKPFHI